VLAGAVVVAVTVSCSVVVSVTVVSEMVGVPESLSVVGVTVVVNVVVDPEVTVTVVPPSPVADKITAHPCDTGTAEPAVEPPADVGVPVRVP
jgi:hypothetical protein